MRTHGIPDEAVEVGRCVTRPGRGGGEVVDGGRLWAWRAKWSPRVTMVRCDKCGLSFCGDLGAALATQVAERADE